VSYNAGAESDLRKLEESSIILKLLHVTFDLSGLTFITVYKDYCSVTVDYTSAVEFYVIR
jgi:hypothetical protein